MNSPVLHYHNVLLPLISAADLKIRHDLLDALTEMDYLIETLSYAKLNELVQEETEMAYWAWWEKVRQKLRY